MQQYLTTNANEGNFHISDEVKKRLGLDSDSEEDPTPTPEPVRFCRSDPDAPDGI